MERAAVGAVAALKTMNLSQSSLSIYFSRDSASRFWLAILALTALATSGGLVVLTGWRAQRLVRWAVAVDVVVAVAVILAAPLFQPGDHVRPWSDWPITVTFLVGAEAAVTFPPLVAAFAMVLLIGAALSWLPAAPPRTARDLVVASPVPFLGFSLVPGMFVFYLRKLAGLADDRALTIRQLEEERTRRVLHTPYRLLNDLAVMLRQEASGNGDDPQRTARLAEAVASVHEIESVVRGTEPASGNLAVELLRLQDQFVDLPLLMNVDDAPADLPSAVVYRIREAVRSALQNVRLHAHAGEVVVYAATEDSSWLVSVHDDGKGFDPGGRLGTGTRELMIGALSEVGATVTIDSDPGRGTLIEFRGGSRG